MKRFNKIKRTAGDILTAVGLLLIVLLYDSVIFIKAKTKK